jgi:pyroglutamyl-peptidase
MKALVTGFSPFGGDAINPSYEAVRGLPRRITTRAGPLDIVSAELPTSFARAARKLHALIAREQPQIVLCVGLAADRHAINVERVAVNLCHARIADNDGAQPFDKPVIARAPAAYSLPVAHAVKALTRAGINADMSLSAGAFVCNHVFYNLMHHVAKNKRAKCVVRAGFVHVPALPRDNPPSALNDLIRGLEIVLRVTRQSIVRNVV